MMNTALKALVISLLAASLLVSTQVFASDDEKQPKSMSAHCRDVAGVYKLQGFELKEFLKECNYKSNHKPMKKRFKDVETSKS